MSKHTPPPNAQSIAQILAEARSHLDRITASQLLQQLRASNQPIHLVDIRPVAQREREGFLILPSDVSPKHRNHFIERNVLEWRLDPQSPSRIEDIVDSLGYDTKVVVYCSRGYTSSLAARELQRIGLKHATDLDGGYWAWKGLQDGKDYKEIE